MGIRAESYERDRQGNWVGGEMGIRAESYERDRQERLSGRRDGDKG